MNILFCSDGSAVAERAVQFAAPIAAGSHAQTTLLGIRETSGDDAGLLESLRRSRQVLQQLNLNPELVTQAGPPVPQIVQHTRQTSYDLVVIGAERRGDRPPLLRSAKAYQITEAVVPPVLVYSGERASLRHILLCSGGWVQSDKAVELSGRIARTTQAAISLFHVLPDPPAMFAALLRRERDADQILLSNSALGRCLRQQQETITRLGVACTVRLRHGMLVPELLRELGQGQYDLVVAGSRPVRDPVRAYMLGNVTRQILAHAQWPVLIVRTQAPPRRWMWRGSAEHSTTKET